MTLLEETACQAVKDYMLDKRKRPNRIEAIKHIRKICGVDMRTAMLAIDRALK